MAKEDLSKFSQDELVEYANNLEKLLNNGMYGLYFNRRITPEDIVLQCQKNIPVLQPIKTNDILNHGEENILIEGDNYAMLMSLTEIYPQGIADVIYIDPPYNTGNNDFAYNDSFVDEEDSFRHTKWLNFMEKRLTLAKDLLHDDGVIFISIDNNEEANLELLCNNIFGETNRISIFPRVIKRGGKSTGDVAKNHDFVLLYAKNADLATINRISVEEDESKTLSDEFVNERGKYKLNQCLDYDSLQYNESMDYEIDIDGEKFYAGGSKEDWEERHSGNHKKIDWVWRWSKPLFEWGLKNGFVVIKDGKRKRIYTKTYANAKIAKNENGDYYVKYVDDSKPYDSLYFVDNRFSNDNAKKELDKFNLKMKFDYPKPSALIKELIKMGETSKNITIMDFFAGSGTTAQAVLELNKEDGGNRKFILCTNNENNIMTDVCYPRIMTAITGKRQDGSTYSDGLPGSVRYFKTDFVEDSSLKEQAKYNLVEQCDGLLCILEDCFDKFNQGATYNIYLNTKKNKSLSIFNDNYDDRLFTEMLNNISKANVEENVVYYFSLDSNIDSSIEKKVLEKVPNAVVKPIPSKIYEIYKKIANASERIY